MSLPIFVFFPWFPSFRSLFIKNVALVGQTEAIVLCPFLSNLWYTYAFFLYSIYFISFFLYSIHFLNSFTRKSLILTFLGQYRLSKNSRFFRNKLYLQMLLDDTCLLAPSARDFCILSGMLKTISVRFLRIVFCFLHFFISLRYFLRRP